MHEVPKVRGSGMTKTTIRHARKLGLYPSVTSILGTLAKPQLERWKFRQITDAAYDERTDYVMPMRQGVTKDEYYSEIVDRAFQQVTDAADAGSLIHNGLEEMMQGFDVDMDRGVYLPALEKTFPLSTFLNPVKRFMEENEVEGLFFEKAIVNKEFGFAGMADLGIQCKHGIGVLDYKTRKTQPGKPCTPYDGQPMQIAAYAGTEFSAAAAPIGCNLYISTTEPGRVEASWYKADQIESEFNAFTHLVRVWQHIKSYNPAHA